MTPNFKPEAALTVSRFHPKLPLAFMINDNNKDFFDSIGIRELDFTNAVRIADSLGETSESCADQIRR